MSKRETQNHRLGEFQITLLKNIAENEPTTINRIKEALDKDYKQVFSAHEKLQNMGYIHEVDSVDYRGRVFPIYWLTELGILKALTEGANPDRIKDVAYQVYPDKENIEWIAEACGYTKFLGADLAKASLALLTRAAGDNEVDFKNLVFTLDPSRMNGFVAFLNEHPASKTLLSDYMKKMFKKLGIS